MIIEDNEDDLFFIKKSLLRNDSINIKVISNGKEAYNYLTDENNIDIVLLDLYLPFMNGLEIMEKLNNAGRDYPIIMLTNDSNLETAVNAMKAGAMDFIPKQPKYYESLPDKIIKISTLTKAQKEKEEYRLRLKESENRFIRLAENAIDIIYRYNVKSGKYDYISPATKKMTGYPPEDFIANDNLFRSIIIDSQKPLYFDFDENRLEPNKQITSHYKIKAKDDTLRWLNDKYVLTASPEGDYSIVEGIITDITHLKYNEEVITKSEQRLSNILNSANEGFIEVDNNLRITDLNPMMANYLHSPRNILIGTPIENFITESSKQELENHLIDLNARKSTSFELTTNIQSSPKHNTLLFNATPLHINSEPSGFFAMVADITERKKYEMLQTVLFDITNAINISKDLTELFRKIRDFLDKIIDTKNFFIALYHEKENTISLPIFHDEKDSFTSFPAKKTLTYYLIKKNKPMIFSKSEILKLRDLGEFEGIGTLPLIWLGVPLNISEKVIGAVIVQSYTDPNCYSYEDLNLLQFVSGQIALAIERKRNQESLKRSEQKYRRIFENIQDVYYETALDGTILELSNSINKISNYERQELIGRNMYEFYQDSARREEMVSLLKEHKQLHDFDIRLIDKDGTIYYCSLNLKLIYDEDIEEYRIIGSLVDITSRILTEKALREREESYRNLFQNAQVGIFRTRLKDGLLHQCNQEFANILGYKSPEEIEKRALLRDYYVDPDDRLKMIEIITDKGEINRYEIPFKRENGEHFWMRYSAKMYKEKGWLEGIAEDVTIEREAEAKIKKLNEELEQNVIDRTSQLEETLEKLKYENYQRKQTQEELAKAKEDISQALEKEKELSELKSRFIAMVSHEYRTPLTVILSSSYLLEKFFSIGDAEKFFKHLENIRYSVHNMTQLLEDILIIGKSDAGKLDYKPEELNLIDLTNDIIEEITIIDEKKHNFVLTHTPEEINVVSDKKLYYQILMNLLTNASKYTPSESNIEIILTKSEQNNSINLKVKDNGIGIPKDTIDSIFDPFFRSTNVGTISGTGLGLTIVKRCIDLLDGRINIESYEKKGTIFSIDLPVKFK